MRNSGDDRFMVSDYWIVMVLLSVLFVLAPIFPPYLYAGFAFFLRSSIVLLFSLVVYRLGADSLLSRLRSNPLILPACGIIALLFAGLFYTPSVYHAKAKAALILSGFILYLLVWLIPLNGSRKTFLLWSLAAGGVLAAFHALYVQWGGHPETIAALKESAAFPDDMRQEMIRSLQANRAMGRFGNPNHLAGYLVLSLWPVWLLWKQVKFRWTRILLFLIAACLVTGIYQTFSRSGLLVLAVSGMLVAGFEAYQRGYRVSWKVLGWIFGIAVFGAIGITILASSGMFGGRLLTVSTIVARIHFYRGALLIAAKNPWLGVGPEGFEPYYCAEIRPGDLESRYVHNAVLESAVEGGILGFLLLVWLMFVVIRYLFRQWGISRKDRTNLFAALGVCVSFLLLSLADFHNNLQEMWLAPVFLLGIVQQPLPSPARIRFSRWIVPVVMTGLLIAWILLILFRFWNENARTDGRYLALDEQKFAARQAYERAVLFDRTDAESWRQIGYVWAEIPNQTAQLNRLDCMRQAVRWAPCRASIRADYADAFFALGYTERALEQIFQAQRLFPARPVYYEKAAGYYRFLKQDQEAGIQIDKANQIKKEIEANRI